MLVKAASWNHNISINKLGYSPLQLATEMAVIIPVIIQNEYKKPLCGSVMAYCQKGRSVWIYFIGEIK